MTPPASSRSVDSLSVTVTRAPEPERWSTRIHARPADTFETTDRWIAVLGLVRRPGGGAVSAGELARDGVVHAGGIRTERITGNGLVVGIERRRPVIHAYRTLQGCPQLYVHADDDALQLSTSLPDLLDRAGPFDADPRSVIDHFTFRFVLQPRTYYRHVHKLPGGHLLTWQDGRVGHRRVRRLEPAAGGAASAERPARPHSARAAPAAGAAPSTPGAELESSPDGAASTATGARPPFTEIDEGSLAWLESEMRRIGATYADHAAARGLVPVTMLSGGVDSVLVQRWVAGDGHDGAHRAGPPRTCSFAIPDAPSFAPETRRAMAAAARLGTDHLVAPVAVADYSDLLDRTIATLARPSLFNETWPCQLTLGAAVRERWGDDVMLFGGHAADGIHGLHELEMVARRERWDRVPGLAPLMRRLAPVLRRLGQAGERLALTARMGADADPLRGPSSLVSLAGELPLLLECFGEDAVRDAFDRRRDLAADAAPTGHPWERMQTTHLFAAGSEPPTAVADLHASLGLDTAMMYRDEEVLAAVAAFDPAVRYLGRIGRGGGRGGGGGSRKSSGGRRGGGSRGLAGAGRVRGVLAGGRRHLKPLQIGLLDHQGLGDLARVAKGGTTFWRDLWRWMDDGPLRDRVMAIERPGFVPPDLFQRVLREPSDFLWNLLVYDVWRSRLSGGVRG